MPSVAPNIISVDMTQIKRGKNKNKTIQTSNGEIHAAIIAGASVPDAQAAITARPFWVIIHAKSGKICWAGRLISVREKLNVEHFFWTYTVSNTLNNFPDDPSSGSDEITVTVVNPDTGPSTPAPITTNVVQVP